MAKGYERLNKIAALIESSMLEGVSPKQVIAEAKSEWKSLYSEIMRAAERIGKLDELKSSPSFQAWETINAQMLAGDLSRASTGCRNLAAAAKATEQ